MIPTGINNLFSLISSLDLLFKLGRQEVRDTLSLKWLVKLVFYWELRKTFEDLGKKKKSILHVTKFPALQQILELCSDPNVVEIRGITIWVCLAEKSLLHQRSAGDAWEGGERAGLCRVNLSPVSSFPCLASGTSGTSWARGRVQTIVFNCHWWTYPPWICLIFFWTHLYFWPLQHPVAVNSTV